MYYKLIFQLIFLFMIAGCGGGGSGGSGGSAGGVACGSGASPYYGCWITVGCQSVTNPFGSDPVWATIRYNFASNGALYDQGKVYSNSSCVGTPVYEWGGHTDLEFSEFSSGLLPSGLTGYRLDVEDITTSGMGTSEVLVAVTAGNQLCLSSSLQLASAEAWVFVWDQTPTDVDLANNCLDAS